MSASLPVLDLYESDTHIARVGSEIVAEAEIRSEPSLSVAEPSISTSAASSAIENVIEANIDVPAKTDLSIKMLLERLEKSQVNLKNVHKNVTFASEEDNSEISGDFQRNKSSTMILARTQSQDKSGFLKTPRVETIPCRYASCGCQELVTTGTTVELEHYQNCNFRPIPCLFEDICTEIVPYHDFVIHFMSHNVQPNFNLNLTTRFFLRGDDFDHDQKWIPKWLSAEGNHFFFMVQRKIPGIWVCWVWMLGSKEEASAYKSSIVFYKGLRSVGGTFIVHGIRETPEQIEMGKNCLLLTDQAMLNLSQIGENCVTDFSISVQITLNTREAYLAAIAEPIIEINNATPSLEAEPASPIQSASSLIVTPISNQPSGFAHEIAPLAPKIEGASDIQLLQEIYNRETVEIEDYGDIEFDEVLKIFTAKKSVRGYDSSASTALTEPSLDQDVDHEFLDGIRNDERQESSVSTAETEPNLEGLDNEFQYGTRSDERQDSSASTVSTAKSPNQDLDHEFQYSVRIRSDERLD